MRWDLKKGFRFTTDDRSLSDGHSGDEDLKVGEIVWYAMFFGGKGTHRKFKKCDDREDVCNERLTERALLSVLPLDFQDS